MDEKSLEMLEFPRVKEILAGYTSFSLSREMAMKLQPLTDYERISLLLKQSGEARRLLSLEPYFSIGGITDVREAVRLAARDKVLEPQRLVEIQSALVAIRELRRNLGKLSKELPLLWSIAEGIVEQRQIEKNIGDCIAPSGELLDTASPRLIELRQRMRDVREHLVKKLEAIVRSSKGEKIVQEPIVTEREGRYVIPLKIESRKELKGIVHDMSNTGATVFVEPWATVELGNELRELVLEEKREVERILKDLSAEVGAHEAEICAGIELAAELDVALAKGKYARVVRATEPSLDAFDGKGVLKLAEARHPLLGVKAVPLSVELGKDFSGLVITGPNTGGKTVALKTAGLLSLMTQAGIPIPALPESSIPVFDGIFADIGDEQNIEQTLSTFSWHISNIVRIIKNTTRKSLVLLDELGTSTDPAEGSALARSILLHFLSQGTMTVATTHYGDLKAFAHTTPGLQNASLDFDPVTLTPTYRLRVGIPGGSNALATALRLGIAPGIVSKAREMLSGGSLELEQMLADVMTEKLKAESLSKDLEKRLGEVELRKAELDNEARRLMERERQVIQDMRDKVLREAADLQREIREALSGLRKEKSKERIEQAKKSLAAVQEKLKGESWRPKPQIGRAGAADDGRIAVGDTVLLKDADVRATVLSVSEESGQVEVQAGQTRLTLSLDNVVKIQSSPKVALPAPVRAVSRPSRRAVPMELDLRGKHADEVEPLLDSYLNDASLANMSEVRIVHGFGTGTVRAIVRDLLASHPLVKAFRSGGRNEGGDGATVVSL
ncbi:MAG: endonuclease MutS2 [Chloroflexi bacterium]|nr:endonuclease MutS2 [Chloroflexota bacterium]